MAYRANVTDNQQSQIEHATNGNAIPVYVRRGVVGLKKFIPSYDLQAQGQIGGSPNDAVLASTRAQMVIGNHNDKPGQFIEPGRA